MKYLIIVLLIIAGAIISLHFYNKPVDIDIRDQVDLLKLSVAELRAQYRFLDNAEFFEKEYDWSRDNLHAATILISIRCYDSPQEVSFVKALSIKINHIVDKNGDPFYVEEDMSGDSGYEAEITYNGDIIFALRVKTVPLQDLGMKGGKLALVIDDFGYSNKNFANIRKLNVPITLAILPNLRYSAVANDVAAAEGLENIVHLPMEPIEISGNLEDNTIMVGMENKDIWSVMDAAFMSVDHAVGINNHMGSKATSDIDTMRSVMKYLKENGKFFLDSFTIGGTVAADAAMEYDVPYVRRDIFIDNKADKQYITGQIKKAVQKAEDQGFAVAIGHDRELTVKAISDMEGYFESRGIDIVPLSAIVNDIIAEKGVQVQKAYDEEMEYDDIYQEG